MAELSLGTVLGNRFEIAGVLGQGGMATVYLAHDRVRDQKVALKVLHDHLSNTPSMRFRLRREVMAAGRIRHPNALVASELHELDGHLALSLPLHSGHTLLDYVAAHGPLPLEGLEKLGIQLAGALAEAHRHGVVHRDVTPSNVMIDAEGNSVLTDFGLARLEDLRSATATSVVGTCGYAAPEVYQGERADPRADLYSLGAVLYLGATGRAPFEAPNPMGVLQRQLHEDLIPLSAARPDLPAWLSETLEAMLHRDPARRPQGAREVIEAFASQRTPAELDADGHPEAISTRAAVGPASSAREPAAGAAPASGARTVEREDSRGSVAGATGAGVSSSASAASTALTLRPLPSGTWTVIVRERREDREWRRIARRKHRRAQRRAQRRRYLATPVRRAVYEFADKVQENVRALFTLPRDVAPEELVARAVALEAGLPPDALIVPEAMLQREFRLVEGVDPGTAARLVNAVSLAGFDARPLEHERWPGGAGSRNELFRNFPKLPPVIPIFLLLFIFGIVPGPVLALVTMSILASMWWSRGASQRSLNHLPLAYPHDLGPYLTAKYGLLTGPSEVIDLPVEAEQSRAVHTEAAPAAPSGSRRAVTRQSEGGEPDAASANGAKTRPIPTNGVRTAEKASKGAGGGPGIANSAAKVPEDRATLMMARTNTQLEALEKALAEARADLPDIMLDDLGVTLKGLRGQAAALGREAGRLQQELSSTDDNASSEAASRIEARLKRIQTLQRAGHGVDAREVADLERGLEAHRKTLEGVEGLEGRLTVALARLLEIGSTAAQVRRGLRQERETGGSSLRLLEQLRQEAASAATALREVEQGRGEQEGAMREAELGEGALREAGLREAEQGLTGRSGEGPTRETTEAVPGALAATAGNAVAGR